MNEKINKRFSIKRITRFREFGIMIALLILCVILSISSPYFLTVNNIFNVLRQFSLYAILSIGQALCIICGCFDLSVGNATGLLGVIGAIFATTLCLPEYLVFFLVLVAGAVWGLINGVIVQKSE
jgi:ribose/xylose/arabinose/galactoside ABC-type transport system permease subunit